MPPKKVMKPAPIEKVKPTIEKVKPTKEKVYKLSPNDVPSIKNPAAFLAWPKKPIDAKKEEFAKQARDLRLQIKTTKKTKFK